MKKSLFLLFLFTSILMACNSRSSTESRYTTSEETEPGYICPMDCEDGKIYEKEGECPVCGMALDESEEED